MASEARCVTAWLCEECIDIANQHPGDEWLSLMTSCVLLANARIKAVWSYVFEDLFSTDSALSSLQTSASC